MRVWERFRHGTRRFDRRAMEEFGKPHLPPEKPDVGRPNADHRRIINGMLWIDRTGAPWRDLPERYGPWRTVASRFYRWQKAGVWDRILPALQSRKDAEGELDWEIHYLDRRESAPARSGRKRGGPRRRL